MTKWVLILVMCSLENNICISPFEWQEHFDDSYDCMMKGYEESLLKTKEFGREKVNGLGMYIKFTCTTIDII